MDSEFISSSLEPLISMASVVSNKTITIIIYDSAISKSVQIAINPRTTAELIFKTIQNSKHQDSTFDSRFFTLLLVITVSNVYKKNNEHCLRTLKNEELLYEIQNSMIQKLMEKHNINDSNKLESSCKWYIKDVRTNPIEFNDNGDVVGDCSSDEDMDITQSDLSYLAKSERKGYLLKRSNHDINLWRKWYCVLLEQLWCIDISKENPTTKCVKLTGMIKYREGYKSLDQLQIIIINSDSGSHYFRAFNIIDQRNWIQDLNDKTNMILENSYFNMAEVIISDEESTKCQRLIKQIQTLLPTKSLIETLECNHYNNNSNNDNNRNNEIKNNDNENKEVLIERTNISINKKQNMIIANSNHTEITNNEMAFSRNHIDYYDESILSSENMIIDYIPDESFLEDNITCVTNSSNKELLYHKDNGGGGDSADINKDITINKDIVLNSTNDSNQMEQLLINTSNNNSNNQIIERTNLLNRIQTINLIQYLQSEYNNLYQIMLFLLDVQKFKELYRFELSISSKIQQNFMKYIYLTYILPQLKLMDIEYSIEFYDQINKLGGNSQDFNKNRTSPLISTTCTGTGLSSYLGEFKISSYTNHYKNDEQNNIINWNIDNIKLLKVHKDVYETYFNITIDSIESLIHNTNSMKIDSVKDMNTPMISSKDNEEIIHTDGINSKDSLKSIIINPSPSNINHDQNKYISPNNNNKNNSKPISTNQTTATTSSFWGSWFSSSTTNANSSQLISGEGKSPTKTASNRIIAGGSSDIWRDISSSKSPNTSQDDNIIIPNIELFDEILDNILENFK